MTQMIAERIPTAETMWIESHDLRVQQYHSLLHTTIVDGASALTIDLLIFIIEKLRLKNGTGLQTPINLGEFQRRQASFTPGAECCRIVCRDIWFTFDWPYAVTPPR